MNKTNSDTLRKIAGDLIPSGLTPQNSCMFWGFECGDGWFDLLQDAFIRLRAIKDSNPLKYKRLALAQVKEKFGTLRMYLTVYTPLSAAVDSLARLASETTCENCGDTSAVLRGTGWYVTLCDRCAAPDQMPTDEDEGENK